MHMELKKMILTALFIALSFCGANIKIFGTIAFDSLPAFLAGLLMGPLYGAIVGFLGHIFTSLLSGFPFGIVIHCIIGISMIITMVGFSLAYKFLESRVHIFYNLVITVVIGTILNSPLSLAICYPFLEPILSKQGIFAMLPLLTLASIANIIIAIVLYQHIKKVWSRFI